MALLCVPRLDLVAFHFAECLQGVVTTELFWGAESQVGESEQF